LPEEFNDPVLKEAVKRAWAGESAPRQLSESISDSVAAPRAQIRPTAGWAAWAAAAVILLCAGLLIVRMAGSSSAPGQALPAFAAAELVRTHDVCCRSNDHHHVPDQYSAQMPDTGRWLSTKAHIAVVAISPGGGWNYMGAGPCGVAGNPSGHLLFRRGNQELSIFSIPATELGVDAKDALYSADIDGHLISAFTRGGGLYCVLAHDPDGKLSASDVQPLRDQILTDFSADSFMATGKVAEPPLAVVLND